MRFIKSTLLVLVSAVFFLLAICLVLAGLMALDHQVTSMVIHAVTSVNMPIAYIVGGLFAFLASLILYGIAGRRTDVASSFSLKGGEGPINISLRAIEDHIAKHFEEKPVVHSVRTRVRNSRDRKRLRVRAWVSVRSEQNIKNAGEAVQREITSCLKESLGLDNVESISVSVDKIITSKSPKPAPAKTSADELP